MTIKWFLLSCFFFSIMLFALKIYFNKLLVQNYCARGETKLFCEQILSHTGQYDVKSDISISIGHFSTECRHNQKTKFSQSQINMWSNQERKDVQPAPNTENGCDRVTCFCLFVDSWDQNSSWKDFPNSVAILLAKNSWLISNSSAVNVPSWEHHK